jgi:hypothetical protein
MGKHGQESSGWQGIVYAGDVWGGCVFQLGKTGRRWQIVFWTYFISCYVNATTV